MPSAPDSDKTLIRISPLRNVVKCRFFLSIAFINEMTWARRAVSFCAFTFRQILVGGHVPYQPVRRVISCSNKRHGGLV